MAAWFRYPYQSLNVRPCRSKYSSSYSRVLRYDWVNARYLGSDICFHSTIDTELAVVRNPAAFSDPLAPHYDIDAINGSYRVSRALSLMVSVTVAFQYVP